MENVEVLDEVLVEPIVNYNKNLKLTKFYFPDPKLVLIYMDLYRGLKILDIGCGSGKLLFTIADLLDSCELFGIDLNEKKIARATKANAAEIDFKAVNAAKLPFRENSFDYITCTNAFSYIENKGRALIEIHRTLKSGGKMLILEGIRSSDYKNKFDKIMRQSPFIKYSRNFVKKTALMSKSYLVSAVK